MRVLGLIPARGGSKGVPRKNLKPLNGQSLIAYTIKAALASAALSKVVVSTDDEEIATESKKQGAEVPFIRPAHLAEDASPTIDTVVHALNYFREKGEQFDAVCLLQPTVPFRASESIDKSIEQFISANADSLISVRQIPHQFNPHWAFEESAESGMLQIATGEKEIISQRQKLPKSYFRDGSIYLTKATIIKEKKSLYGNRITYLENEGEPLINIDTPEDWKRAEEYIATHEG